MILVFVPPNCTSKLQVADVVLQRPFKAGIRRRFEDWLSAQVDARYGDSNADLSLKALTPMAVLRPELMRWAYRSWENLSTRVDLILKGWSKCILLDPFDKETQKMGEAASRKGLVVHNFIFKEEQPEPNDDGYRTANEGSDDDGKDELDLAKEIILGTRRSPRIVQAGTMDRGLGNIDTWAIVFDDDSNASSESSESSSESDSESSEDN